ADLFLVPFSGGANLGFPRCFALCAVHRLPYTNNISIHRSSLLVLIQPSSCLFVKRFVASAQSRAGGKQRITTTARVHDTAGFARTPPSSNMAFCFQCVSNSEVGVVERLGKFTGLAAPGLNCILWPIDNIVAKISTRVQQLDVRMETKTKDNVFVTAVVSVQYQPIKEKIYDAFYRLTDPQAQIRSYVFDVVRSTLPKLDLDQAFDSKEDIAVAVKNQLEEVMKEYGYMILQALVTDMDPDPRVKEAMNEINASKRMREAATNKAEADKIMQVKAAEAEAESKYLSGVGVSRQRKAIVDGLRDSVQTFAETIDGTSPKDVMDLLLLTQYFDMLRDVGQSSRAATVFLPHAPQSVAAIQAAMRDGFMQGQAGSTDTPPPNMQQHKMVR
ncbi:unnamed protein product, partial [Ectocarpus fasciculatus]